MPRRVGVEIREEGAEEAEDEGDRGQRDQRDDVGTREVQPLEEAQPWRLRYRRRLGRFEPPRFCWTCRFDSREETSRERDFGSGTGTATVPSTR